MVDYVELKVLSGLSKPAQRALAAAGYTTLQQLTEVSEAEVGRMHGVGPKAIGQLRQALTARGLSFATHSATAQHPVQPA